MTDKISRAAARLNCILPMVRNLSELDADEALVHKTILHAYAMNGEAPEHRRLVSMVNDIAGTLASLQSRDLIVLDADGCIRGAYPFTSEPRIHRVSIGEHIVHCMCALDSLAVSPMFQQVTHIHSKCIISGVDIAIHQDIDRVLNPHENREVYFAIDWGAASDGASCADSLCGCMDFIKGEHPAKNWLAKSTHYEIFTLYEAIEFATRFFMPHLYARYGT